MKKLWIVLGLLILALVLGFVIVLTLSITDASGHATTITLDFNRLFDALISVGNPPANETGGGGEA